VTGQGKPPESGGFKSRSPELENEQRAALAELRGLWGGAYFITCPDGVWCASPFADRATVLTADSAPELRALIRKDYGRRHPMSSSGP